MTKAQSIAEARFKILTKRLRIEEERAERAAAKEIAFAEVKETGAAFEQFIQGLAPLERVVEDI